MKSPEECVCKADIRSAIDALDEELLVIFARRQGYVRRMAQLKQHPDEAFDGERIETMVAAIRDRAEELGLEGEQVDEVWRTLIAWNVAWEQRTIAARLEAGEKKSGKTAD